MVTQNSQLGIKFDLLDRLNRCYQKALDPALKGHCVWEFRRLFVEFVSTPIACLDNFGLTWYRIMGMLKLYEDTDMNDFISAEQLKGFLQELIKFYEFNIYKFIIKNLRDYIICTLKEEQGVQALSKDDIMTAMNDKISGTKGMYQKAQKEMNKIMGELKKEFYKNVNLNKEYEYMRVITNDSGAKIEFKVSIHCGKIKKAVVIWKCEGHTSEEIDVTKSLKLKH